LVSKVVPGLSEEEGGKTMINYRFGDRVKHPNYGRCVFGGYLDEDCEEVVIWNGDPDGCMLADVSDLILDDPRIIQINGLWHRVYTPLDVEEARRLVGKEVRFFDNKNRLPQIRLNILKAINTEAARPYYGRANWFGIASPIESEPEKKPEPDYERLPSGLILWGRYANAVCALLGIGEEKE
jgi:hypothetical protein